MILRPYMPSTSPASEKIGNTTEPFMCSWPLSARRMPSRCKRPRRSAPALRFLSGSVRPSLRLAKPSLKWPIISGCVRPRRFEIPQRFGRFLQRLVIKLDHVAQGLLIVGIRRDRRRRASPSCPCERRDRSPAANEG